MTARRILLVEDEADLREALVEQLSLFDEFEISEAGSATEAIKLCKEDNVDLLIFDVGLPAD